MEIEDKTLDSRPHKNRVHRILAHSYTMYFILFLIGVCLDITFRFKIFTGTFAIPVGIIFLVFASLLIIWAQKTSRNLKTENLSKETFCRGPYCFTRTPTHWGLFFLILGFGIIADAPFVVSFTIISFLISKFIFLEKQERILEERYGVPYTEYKKAVKF
ncbi:MAG: hypothetical protein NTZ87_03525 [Candidatus Nomurabacteria bacterium]|nr:hypothetical protein [Candidatus Nomurabacteria bacterium]